MTTSSSNAGAWAITDNGISRNAVPGSSNTRDGHPAYQ